MSAETIDVPATPAVVPSAQPAPIAGAKPAALSIDDRGIKLTSTEEAFRFAKAVVESGLAPSSFKTPQAVMIAIQMGMELGLPPMQALQGIAVINGRPAIYGDALIGIVAGSGLLEDIKDEVIGEGDARGYRVTAMRKGRNAPIVRTFTVADAKRANLWGKSGPWSQYPDRMLLMRARSFALRDGFADVLRGVISVEEAGDTPRQEKNVTPSLDSIDGDGGKLT